VRSQSLTFGPVAYRVQVHRLLVSSRAGLCGFRNPRPDVLPTDACGFRSTKCAGSTPRAGRKVQLPSHDGLDSRSTDARLTRHMMTVSSEFSQ
jgi:hypothetical protein